jgi:AraC-like DNA-binding protein
MLTSSVILPHPALSAYISNYAVCEAGTNVSMRYPWFANYETTLIFYFADTPFLIKQVGANRHETKMDKVSLCGLFTQFNGNITFDGIYNTFLVEFKPNGFNKLFKLPAQEICNNVFAGSDILGKRVEYLYQQLLHTTSAMEKVFLTDNFLLEELKRQKSVNANDGITKISSQLLTTHNLNRVTEYANEANMSIRSFERRFTEQVGISPKLFSRLYRFNSAFKSKMYSPTKSWADIAFEFGYYDTLHLIKEFKQFANASPVALFNANPDFFTVTLNSLDRTSP